MSNSAPSPLDLLRRHNLSLKKSLGQNLLVDPSHLTRIAAAADLEKSDTVLEIGPGLGALTHRPCPTGRPRRCSRTGSEADPNSAHRVR